jgi:hypothetical protein
LNRRMEQSFLKTDEKSRKKAGQRKAGQTNMTLKRHDP